MSYESPPEQEREPTPSVSAAPAGDAHPERFCPNCGAELVERACKLLCPNRQCGYAMSCSDFY